MKRMALVLSGIIIAAAAVMVVCQAAAPVKPSAEVKNSPDLVVSDIKVDKSDPKNVKIIYTVKNQGDVKAEASKTAIQVTPQAKKGMKKSIVSQTPTLPPGGIYTKRIVYPIAEKGDYIIKATADYNDRVTESNETNNYNTLGFSIGVKL